MLPRDPAANGQYPHSVCPPAGPRTRADPTTTTTVTTKKWRWREKHALKPSKSKCCRLGRVNEVSVTRLSAHLSAGKHSDGICLILCLTCLPSVCKHVLSFCPLPRPAIITMSSVIKAGGTGSSQGSSGRGKPTGQVFDEFPEINMLGGRWGGGFGGGIKMSEHAKLLFMQEKKKMKQEIERERGNNNEQLHRTSGLLWSSGMSVMSLIHQGLAGRGRRTRALSRWYFTDFDPLAFCFTAL